MSRTKSASIGATTSPRPGASRKKALVAQKQERLLHGLPGDAERFGQVILDEPRIILEPPGGDFRENFLVDLFGEAGLALKGRTSDGSVMKDAKSEALNRAGAGDNRILNSEFT